MAKEFVAKNGLSTGQYTTAQISAMTPTTPVVVYDSDKDQYVHWNGTIWAPLGGGLIAETKSANFAAESGKHYLVDTTSGVIAATLPSGSSGFLIRFSDMSETWDTYNLTITPASGEKIDNLAIDEALICDVKRGWVELTWDSIGLKWSLSSLASTQVVDASPSQRGAVNTTTQSFAGDKTFNGLVGTGGAITPSGYFSDSNQVVAYGTGNSGISIISGSTSKSVLSFGYTTGTGVGTGSNRGKIWYDHSNDSFNFGSSGGLYTGPMGTMSSSGVWTLGPTSGSGLIAYVGAAGAEFRYDNASTYLHILPGDAGGNVVLRAGANSGAAPALVFQNDAGTERGRMADNGAWQLGTSAVTGTHLAYSGGSTGVSVFNIVKPSQAQNTNNNFYMQFTASGGSADGYIQTNGSGTLTIVDASDKRLKTNIKDASYGLSTIMALRPVEYDWKDSDITGVKGFIAQEVKEVLPESVSIRDESESGGFLDAHYLELQTMIPVLVKAVQELKAENETLKNSIEDLKKSLKNP